MKSLILKDLYNIAHNAKSLILMLLVFLVLLLPVNGTISYVVMSCIIFSMMIVTTFAFDENAKWTEYAIIMPISKRQIVMSKFIVSLIFTLIGAVFGFVFGAVGGILFKNFDYMSLAGWLSLLLSAGLGIVIAFFFGSTVIPLLYKYGAEKARVLSLVAFALPAIILMGCYQLLLAFGVVLNSTLVVIGLLLLPVFVLIWSIFMFNISCQIFGQKEF